MGTKSGERNSAIIAQNREIVDHGAQSRKTVAYLRVSTVRQDAAKNRAEILAFANDRDLGQVRFVEETVSGTTHWRDRKLGGVLDELEEGDVLLVSEISRLARSMLQILEVLQLAREKGILVYAIKGGWTLDDSMQSKIVSGLFAMVAEIERDLISERTSEALAARKAAGVTLGRPRGPGRSKLDRYEPEIRALLSTGSTLRYIAKRYGCAESTVANWLSKRRISRESLVSASLEASRNGKRPLARLSRAGRTRQSRP